MCISSHLFDATKFIFNYDTRYLKKFAGIRRTQNPFSGYIYLMCRGVVTCLFIGFLFLIVQDFHSLNKLKKPIIQILSKVVKRKTVDLYCLII